MGHSTGKNCPRMITEGQAVVELLKLFISLPVDGKGSLEGFGCVRARRAHPAGPKGPQRARRARTRARRAREGERSETVVPEATD